NPYGMSWAGDLEEMLVRFGREIGWERVDERSLDYSRSETVVGHHDPDSRSLMPPGSVLEAPALAPASAWMPDLRRPPSTYAPAYASAVLPADAQVAVFPRGDRFVVVGAIELPEDTTRVAREAPPERSEPFRPWRGLAAEVGLFLMAPLGTLHEVR